MKHNFEKYFSPFFYILLLVSIFCTKNCLCQKVIKLDEVTKIELVTRAGGLSSDYRRIEVVPESGGWKCYQTSIKGSTLKGIIDNSSKIFIKDVSSNILTQLLKIIAKQDTGINIDLFKINTTKLISTIDSIGWKLQVAPKERFIKVVQSKVVLQKTLREVLTSFMMDDRTYYGITINTKENVSFTIKAYSFGYLYYLPWEINNIKSYDPNISIIFEIISGNDNYPTYEKRRLYLDMARRILNEY